LVKVKSTITLELESSSQKLTIDIQEAKQIIKSLVKFVNDANPIISQRRAKATRGTAKTRKGSRANKQKDLSRKSKSSLQIKGPSMSETKRQEIIDHVNKQLSARPKTLSALLKGISYVPNYLPAIRQMVESRGNIKREVIGKRVYYSRKASSLQRQTRANAATP
jgi:hypothetical protein